MTPVRQCQRAAGALRTVFDQSSTSTTFSLPSFLVPFLTPSQCRNFSSTTTRCSKIGRTPLSCPPDVTFSIHEPQLSAKKVFQRSRYNADRTETGSTIKVKGPLGEMSMTIPSYVTIASNEERREHTLAIQDENDKTQKAMWGTTRANLANHILGVSEGHSAILRLVGVGYRATVEKNATTVKPAYPDQQYVSLKVGYSHPIELGVPRGVKASCPQPTRILLEGVEKEVVKQFAAEIREWRKPEPYKGKGIFVNDETIRLKNKKIK